VDGPLRRILHAACALTLTVQSAASAPAPSNAATSPRTESEIDIAQLVRELQWTASDPNDLSMVWLLPPVLLRTLLVQGSSLTPGAARQAMSVFDPYLVVGVVRGRFDETGAPVLEPAVVIENSVRLVLDTEEVLYPVADPDSNAVKALIQMERTLAGTLGDLGAHTTFLLFSGTSPSGHAVFPMIDRAAFAVELSALGPLAPQRVAWRMPLASLVRDRVCPRCRQGFNGAWTYCPWSGELLRDPDEIDRTTRAPEPPPRITPKPPRPATPQPMAPPPVVAAKRDSTKRSTPDMRAAP
jgi:hypothetical protein